MVLCASKGSRRLWEMVLLHMLIAVLHGLWLSRAGNEGSLKEQRRISHSTTGRLQTLLSGFTVQMIDVQVFRSHWQPTLMRRWVHHPRCTVQLARIKENELRRKSRSTLLEDKFNPRSMAGKQLRNRSSRVQLYQTYQQAIIKRTKETRRTRARWLAASAFSPR